MKQKVFFVLFTYTRTTLINNMDVRWEKWEFVRKQWNSIFFLFIRLPLVLGINLKHWRVNCFPDRSIWNKSLLPTTTLCKEVKKILSTYCPLDESVLEEIILSESLWRANLEKSQIKWRINSSKYEYIIMTFFSAFSFSSA